MKISVVKIFKVLEIDRRLFKKKPEFLVESHEVIRAQEVNKCFLDCR